MSNIIDNNYQIDQQEAKTKGYRPIPIKKAPVTAEDFHKYEKDTFHQLLQLKVVPCKCGTMFSPNGPGGNRKGNGTRQYRMECKNDKCAIKTFSLRKYLKQNQDKGEKWQAIHTKALDSINEMDKLVPMIKSDLKQVKVHESSDNNSLSQGTAVDDSEVEKYESDAEEGSQEFDQYHHESEYESADSYDDDDDDVDKENNDGRTSMITPTPKPAPSSHGTPKTNSNRFAILAKRPVELTPEQKAKKSRVRSESGSEDEDPEEPSLRDLVLGLQRQLKEQQLVIEKQQQTISELTKMLAHYQRGENTKTTSTEPNQQQLKSNGNTASNPKKVKQPIIKQQLNVRPDQSLASSSKAPIQDEPANPQLHEQQRPKDLVAVTSQGF
jgi:hypothetical protein